MARSLWIAVAVGLVVALSASETFARGERNRVTITAPTLAISQWQSSTDNLVTVHGTIRLGGRPVAGVRLRVDGYELSAATDANGGFTSLVDQTLLARHLITVADSSQAQIGGAPLGQSERRSVDAAQGSISVLYPIRMLHISRDRAGRPVIEGRLGTAGSPAPPSVALYSYKLAGTVRDADGKPVVGARVSTRTVDRDYWTVSTPTNAQGRYTSLFTASSEQAGNPVPFTVRVSVGDLVYGFLPDEFVRFQRLKSANLDIRLPPRGYPMALPLPQSFAGEIDEGITVGVSADGAIVRPVHLQWLDKHGGFRMVLPRALAGLRVTLWEAKLDLFSRVPARAGGPVDLRDWPTQVPGHAPHSLVTVRLS